ncbi:exodeoxyribonuclease VII large subunit [Nocardioides piscis]|uniref:exodeoxyribonuclease VII large subunit n=1 Tax=Nocardioides piscis TaxID=2714938 RepID=UPI0031B579F6
MEGQLAQVSRRPGINTVFMTLRDTVADISIPLTCQRTLFDSLNPPLVEGASVVVHARPSFYPNRGTFSLQAREIRMVGIGELLAQLERRRQLLAAEGLFAPELKRDLPFLPARIGLITAPTARPSATSSTTRGGAGRRSSSRSPTPPCRECAARPR